MNIKQHIEAGHYEKDDLGRALVTSAKNLDEIWTVVCTDKPGDPIVAFNKYGSIISLSADGSGLLLPPAPPKVRHMATLCIPILSNGRRDASRAPTIELGNITSAGEHNKQWRYVLLTGESEEPWE